MQKLVQSDMSSINAARVDRDAGYNPTRISPPRNIGVPPMGNRSLLNFIESPSFNYAGSEPAILDSNDISFAPVPEDIRDIVLSMAKNSEPTDRRVVSPQQGMQSHPSQTLSIPKEFDFDLFEFSVLKDLIANIDKIIHQLDESKNKLEQHKKTISDALSRSSINREK